MSSILLLPACKMNEVNTYKDIGNLAPNIVIAERQESESMAEFKVTIRNEEYEVIKEVYFSVPITISTQMKLIDFQYDNFNELLIENEFQTFILMMNADLAYKIYEIPYYSNLKRLGGSSWYSMKIIEKDAMLYYQSQLYYFDSIMTGISKFEFELDSDSLLFCDKTEGLNQYRLNNYTLDEATLIESVWLKKLAYTHSSCRFNVKRYK